MSKYDLIAIASIPLTFLTFFVIAPLLGLALCWFTTVFP